MLSLSGFRAIYENRALRPIPGLNLPVIAIALGRYCLPDPNWFPTVYIAVLVGGGVYLRGLGEAGT
ncbi:MAG: hypothetical protein KO254_01245 [Methanoculleus marisnigri]|nr:hypothetical protein [Methanoculleus marisnigri]